MVLLPGQPVQFHGSDVLSLVILGLQVRATKPGGQEEEDGLVLDHCWLPRGGDRYVGAHHSLLYMEFRDSTDVIRTEQQQWEIMTIIYFL